MGAGKGSQVMGEAKGECDGGGGRGAGADAWGRAGKAHEMAGQAKGKAAEVKGEVKGKL